MWFPQWQKKLAVKTPHFSVTSGLINVRQKLNDSLGCRPLLKAHNVSVRLVCRAPFQLTPQSSPTYKDFAELLISNLGGLTEKTTLLGPRPLGFTTPSSSSLVPSLGSQANHCSYSLCRCLASALQRLTTQRRCKYLLPVPAAILARKSPTPEGRASASATP